ncbi:MAG TPA: CDP-alcohol phosphatidyltransferase family protein [Sumerlaeia bacterium]|nr:CDP-alcohol phosphatidyltransferase family protein [Sumerlaeia bacterium]
MGPTASILRLPNLLTLLRLAALPLTIVLFRREYNLVAACVFVVGMITDCFDGWIARRLHQETPLGLYLDPVVDKIVILALFYELANSDLIHPAIAHLFLARELLHSAVRASAAVKGQVAGANWMGKAKAVLQTILIAWGLLTPTFAASLPAALANPLRLALAASMWTVLCVSWGFFAVFAFWNRRLFREKERESRA